VQGRNARDAFGMSAVVQAVVFFVLLILPGLVYGGVNWRSTSRRTHCVVRACLRWLHVPAQSPPLQVTALTPGHTRSEHRESACGTDTLILPQLDAVHTLQAARAAHGVNDADNQAYVHEVEGAHLLVRAVLRVRTCRLRAPARPPLQRCVSGAPRAQPASGCPSTTRSSSSSCACTTA